MSMGPVVVLSAEDETSPVVARANRSLKDFERQAQVTHEKYQGLLENSTGKVGRLVGSMERLNQTYGRGEVEQLVFKQQALLKQFEAQPVAIEAITSTYKRMIATAQSKDIEEGMRAQAASVRDFGNALQNPIQAAEGLIQKMGPLGMAIGAGVAALGSLAVAGFQAAKSLGEMGVHVEDAKIRLNATTKEVGQLAFVAKVAGTDIETFTGLMRGLTTAVEDQSEKGAKGRAWLQAFGVDLKAVKNGNADTVTVLRQVATGLDELSRSPDPFAKANAGMAIFNRRYLEAAPALDHLKKDWEDSSRIEVFGDKELENALAYQKQITIIEHRWDMMVAHAKEWIASKVLGSPERFSPDVAARFARADEDWAEDHPAPPIPKPAPTVDKHLLAEIAQAAKDTRAETAKVMSAAENAGNENKAVSFASEQNAFADRMIGLNPAWKSTEVASQWRAAVKARLNELTQAVVKERQLAEEKLHNEIYNPLLLSNQRNLMRDMTTDAEKTLRDYAKSEAADREVASVDLQSQRNTLNRQASGAHAMVSANGLTGTDAINATYQIRMRLAEQLADIEMQRIAKETAADQKRVATAYAIADLAKESAEAQQEAALKLAELQHQQYEGLKKDTEGLWDTLLTHPQNFGKQLGETIHGAVIKPIAEGMAGMTAGMLQPLIYGKDGGGGLAGMFKGSFGGKRDISVITDRNSDVTEANTRALSQLTGIMAGAPSGTAASTSSGSLPSISGIRSPIAAMAAAFGLAASPAMAMHDRISPSFSMPSASVSYGGGDQGGGYSPTAWSGGGGTSDVTSGDWMSGGSAGMPTYAGGGSSGGGGFNPLAMMGGRGGGFNPASMFKGLINKQQWGIGEAGSSNGFGGGKASLGDSTTDISGGTSFGSVMTSKAAGSLMLAGGMPLATAGLTGGRKGTWGGFAESAAGGALTGAGIGTMILPGIGTLIGAGVGLMVGAISSLAEMAMGDVSPAQKAHDAISAAYKVNIPVNSGTIKQVVSIAGSEFGGDVSVAVHSPKVRQLVMLYSEATGQKMPMSASTPYAGSLAESGGNLYQEATYQNGQAYTYASNLPTLGGLATQNYPTPSGPSSGNGSGVYQAAFTVNLNGQPITPEFVADASMSAQGSSYGRTQQAANLNVPGLMVGT